MTWILVGIAAFIICGAQVGLLALLAYRGALGVTLWKWTRIPFAVAGGLLMSVGMNGVAIPRNENEEQEEEEIVSTQASDEPGNEDNQFGRFVWSLKGLTPIDVMNQCVSQAQGNHFYDPEFDELCETIEPRESLSDFRKRKQLERVA